MMKRKIIQVFSITNINNQIISFNVTFKKLKQIKMIEIKTKQMKMMIKFGDEEDQCEDDQVGNGNDRGQKGKEFIEVFQNDNKVNELRV